MIVTPRYLRSRVISGTLYLAIVNPSYIEPQHIKARNNQMELKYMCPNTTFASLFTNNHVFHLPEETSPILGLDVQ